MTLTAEMVARIACNVLDPGPRPDLLYHSEEDYDNVVKSLLAAHAVSDLWVFAYGSLIWKPEFEHVEHCRATAAGWHRSFCMKITRWRGTTLQPGLMMGLDRGGSCQGLAYRLPAENHFDQLGRIVRREMSVKPATNVPLSLIHI